MYASVVIILISDNSESPLLGNAEVKNLNVGFHFLMKILPYEKSVMTFPELEAIGMTFFPFFSPPTKCIHPWVLISSPSLTILAPMASTPPQHSRSLQYPILGCCLTEAD